MKLVKERIKSCERLLNELANDRLSTGEMKIILKYHLTGIIERSKLELKESR